MKTKAQKLKILVVNVGTSEKSCDLFCGIDKHRIVFFKELNLMNLYNNRTYVFCFLFYKNYLP